MECPICFELDGNITIHCCKRIYHLHCLERWPGKCPTCRESIRPDEDDMDYYIPTTGGIISDENISEDFYIEFSHLIVQNNNQNENNIDIIDQIINDILDYNQSE
jgi:hypothetical protein